MNANLNRAVWAAVAVGSLVGLGVIVVLLRGDPTYLVKARTRGGAPWGAPAPISFAWRAFSTTVLVVGLFLAGRRAVSDIGVDLRLPALIGYTLFVLDTAVWACVGPMFPAFLVNVWLVVLLVGIMYSNAISDLVEGPVPAPPWVFWGTCVLALATRPGWTLLSRSSAGS